MSKGVVVITGGSRGIGAEIGVEAARAGYDVVLGYRDKEKRAAEVVSRITALGRAALAVPADITKPHEARGMLCTAREFASDRQTEISALVLSAAGGLERNATKDDADRINARTPLAMAVNFLNTERDAGTTALLKTVVFVTSNPSHFYGNPRNVMPSEGYDVVANTKHKGESILREELGDDDFEIDHRLLVATADLVDGTAGATLLRREYKAITGNREADLLAERSAQLQGLIGRGITNASEFGGAIVGLFMNQELPHGHTLYVPQPVLGEYVVPEADLPFGLADPAMHTFLA